MSIFGRKPGIIPPASTHAIGVLTFVPGATVSLVNVDPATYGARQTAGADGSTVFNGIPPGTTRIKLAVTAPDYQEFNQDVTVPDRNVNVVLGPCGPTDVSVSPMRKMFVARRGVPRPAGRHAVTDDDGLFHPLGMTMFWAMCGWKFDRARFKQNIEFLRPYGFDYVRILAEVGWAGEEIDPNWPDYQQVLGEVIDYLYDENGLRSEIAVLGGGTGHDSMDVARKVVAVLTGRTHKIMDIEASNEGNGADLATLVQMAKYLRASTPNLVALTSIGYATGDVQAATVDAGATLFTLHTDRGAGDNKWRQVRQGWDFKDLPGVVTSNEPPGPNSSGETNDNPLQLAMMRATGVLSGGALYVLHVGDMVAGRVDPAHNRHANLWEVPNIDAILKAARGVDKLLPLGIEDWLKFNNSWGGHPLTTDAFFGDGADHGVNRNYAAVNGGQFVVVVNGVLKQASFKVTSACHVDAYDPVTLAIKDSVDLAAGQQWTLPGRDDTMAGYVVIGQLK
jgi:hypothetical protein